MAESMIILGNTAYPCPGSITSILKTLSKFMTALNTAGFVGAGYNIGSMYAVTFGGSVYPLPPFNINAAGKSIEILAPGMCADTAVPFTPLVKPVKTFNARSTDEYPICSVPILIIPLIGNPCALSTANDLVFNEIYDARIVIGASNSPVIESP